MAARTQLQNLNEVHKRAMDDALKYSQAMIIAQRMILDGFTEATAMKVLDGHVPLENNIINFIRDIERNHLLPKHDPKRLRQLAEQLR